MLCDILFSPHTFSFFENVLGSSALAMVSVFALGIAGCAVAYAVDNMTSKQKNTK